LLIDILIPKTAGDMAKVYKWGSHSSNITYSSFFLSYLSISTRPFEYLKPYKMATSISDSGPRGEDVSRAAALQVQEYLSSRLTTKSSTVSFRSIPVIDIGPSFSTSEVARKEVAYKIHEACTTVGFFYITGHGSEEVCVETLKLAERFFAQVPQSSKDAIHIKNSKYFRGYEPASYSTVNGLDAQGKETKEAFNWGYERGLDPTGGDGKYVELDGSPEDPASNQWPSESDIPGFFKGISEYYGRVSYLLKIQAGCPLISRTDDAAVQTSLQTICLISQPLGRLF